MRKRRVLKWKTQDDDWGARPPFHTEINMAMALEGNVNHLLEFRRGLATRS
jgi:hypothetical protein